MTATRPEADGGPGASSQISVAAIVRRGSLGYLLRLLSPALDRILGIRRVRTRLYQRDGLAGLDRFSFVERFVEAERIRFSYDPAEFRRIPETGPTVVVANHPLGGLEGILLTWLMRLARPDYKVFVNVMLMFIEELRDYYIFTNPAAKGSRANFRSIGQAKSWLAGGHCLLVFPAGRVGLYRPEKGYVTDEAWDQIALSLGGMTGASFVPVFIEGESSRLFSFLSRYVFPMKLLFLIWEFLGSLGKRVVFHVGRPVPYGRLASMGRRRANAWLRMYTYLQCPVRDDGGAGGPSPRARALAAAVARGGVPAGKRPSRGLGFCRGEVHPEVEDYIRRYGMDAAELAELVGLLDGDPAVPESPGGSAGPDARPGGAQAGADIR